MSTLSRTAPGAARIFARRASPRRPRPALLADELALERPADARRGLAGGVALCVIAGAIVVYLGIAGSSTYARP